MSGALPRRAVHRATRWPGWIWTVPIAAVAIVGWLGIRALLAGGRSVIVIFPGVADISADNTKVTFNGMAVGEVTSVAVEKDLRHMRVGLSLHADMAGHLGPGTRFWLEGTEPSLTDLSDLKSIVSGPSIGIDPQPGRAHGPFHALAAPPAAHFGMVGTSFMLRAARLGSVQRRTPIFYRGQQVGRVGRIAMLPGGEGFTISAFIEAPYDALVHDGTRFWNAGAIRLAGGGGAAGVQFQSVSALFAGAIDFATQGGTAAGGRAAADHGFTLYADEDAAESAPAPDSVRYRVVFRNPTATLKAGAPVTLAGRLVGDVEQARLAYDPAEGELLLQATIAVDPGKVQRTAGNWGAGRAQMDAMLQHLIGHGLRAQLQTSPPLIGGGVVALAMVGGDAGTTLGAGDPPLIPAASGGGAGGLLASAQDVVGRINAMPLGQIAEEMHQVTAHLAALTASPHLADTLRQIDEATAALDRVAASAQHEMPATLAEVRHAVAEASRALRDTTSVLARSSAGGPSGPESADLPHTLYEVARAARALREFADYLDRNPQALLTGRGGP